jgi:hypothetical protein
VNVLKSDFGDFDEAMFHDVGPTLERIFYILDIQKSFRTKSMKCFLSRRMALRTHNLHSGRLKKDFGEVDDAIFKGVKRPLELNFCILSIEKSDLDEDA